LGNNDKKDNNKLKVFLSLHVVITGDLGVLFKGFNEIYYIN